jgi:small-conductance mechanosensitive channel
MSCTRAWIVGSLCALSLLGTHDARAADPDSQKPSTPPAAPSASPLPIKSEQVLSHVSRTVDWYRGLQSVEELQGTARDLLPRDRLQAQSLTALRLAFEFGRASAAILRGQPSQGGDTGDDSDSSTGFAAQLDQMSDRVTQRVAALQSQLSTLDEQIAHARRAQKATLTARRGDVSAALALAREVQSSLQDIERFEDDALLSDSKGQGRLAAQIRDLEKSVPEAARRTTRSGSASSGKAAPAGNSAPADSATGGSGGGSTASGSGGGAASGATAASTASSSSEAAAESAFRPSSAGIMTLVAQWFSLHDTRRQLTAAIRQTDSLTEEVNGLRETIGGAVRNIVQTVFASSTGDDAPQLNGQKAQLEAGTAQFKKLSTVLVPLGEQALTLDAAQSSLQEWGNHLAAFNSQITRYLVLRAGFLMGCIAVVLLISEVWRRATFRYLHDSRRRRQFLTLRRVVVGIALTMVIVFGLVSELGSLATYIGFVTAGIAVALQNVILAVAGYFFLIGRHGVRVGDRITLAGVTGRVVDIGLIRIYLMELAGPELHSTGRIVVLSNAVLFQPQALFKQVPGAEYVWHTITLTLAATADVVEANKRLGEAAESVYGKYRPSIERLRAVMQRTLDFETSTPQPDVRVRWSESGVECGVRYPVEVENAASVDQQMLKALRDSLAKDPPLQLASTGGVALKLSDS